MLTRSLQLEQLLKSAMAPARRIELQRKLIDALEREAADLQSDVLPRRRIYLKLARAYIEIGDEMRAAAVARRLLDRIDDPNFAVEIAKLIPLLEPFERVEYLLELSERLFAHVPDDAEIALLHARLMRQAGRPREAEFRVLQRALSSNPIQPAILTNLVRCTIGRVRVPAIESEAEAYAKRLLELRPTAATWLLYGRLLLVQGRQGEAIAAFDNIGPRLNSAALGPLRAPLTEFCALCNVTYRTDTGTDLGALRLSLNRSRQQLKEFLQSNDAVTAEQLESAARQLLPLRVLLPELVRVGDVGEKIGNLGTLNFEPFRLLEQAVSDHLLMILEAGLSEAVLARPVKNATVIRKLADTYSLLLLALGDPARARSKLDSIAGAGFDQHISPAQSRAAMFATFEETRRSSDNGSPNLHRMANWDVWSDKLVKRTIARSDQRQSSYTVIAAKGGLACGTYIHQPVHIETATANSLRLRDSELLISTDGVLLMPNPMHGTYPPRLPSVVGATTQSVALHPTDCVTISDPVVLLGLNNCARVTSYGHWTIFILPRINLALEAGLLEQRKLLMPAELTKWMIETLALIGLRDDQVLFYRRHQQVLVEDAKIISPIDSPGNELLKSLKEKMRSGAAQIRTEQPGNAGPFLFLARRGTTRRIMLDEEETCALAQKLGFTVIAPETFSVAEQVKIFSSAKAVAGPGGSAFANIIFCDGGTRVLCLKGEEKISPFILDLATDELEFRWLLGPAVPSLARHMHPLDAPFRIDFGELERQLTWAMERSLSQTM